MQPTVQVEGVDELRAAIRAIKDKELAGQLKDSNKSAAQIVVDRALPNVPVRSGRLRSSVRALGSQRSGQAKAGKANVPYAAAIHWGRRAGNVGRPPGNRTGASPIGGRPFLWDAAQAVESQVAEQYERDIDRLMDAIRSR